MYKKIFLLVLTSLIHHHLQAFVPGKTTNNKTAPAKVNWFEPPKITFFGDSEFDNGDGQWDVLDKQDSVHNDDENTTDPFNFPKAGIVDWTTT